MLTTALGFATALVYGFADFFGAVAARRINPVLVTLVSGVTGLGFLVSLTGIFGARFDAATIAWGVAAGAASAFAMTCLYASLAIGPISILSPLGAVVSAIVPAMVGFALGDRFSWIGWVALVLILVAVVFVGFIPGAEVRLPSARGLLLGLGAGVGIGAVLICLNAAPGDSGLGPVILMRGVSAALLGLLLVAKLVKSGLRTQLIAAQASKRFWVAVGAAGIMDASANLFFLLATRVPDATLTVVSVLTALYPLGTIVLARLILNERIARVQLFGILLALTGSAILSIA